jgi:hypothetical protein
MWEPMMLARLDSLALAENALLFAIKVSGPREGPLISLLVAYKPVLEAKTLIVEGFSPD